MPEKLEIPRAWLNTTDSTLAGGSGKVPSDGMVSAFVRASGTVTSSATPTPSVGTAGARIFYTVMALAVGATFGAPTGTPVDGQELIIRIKDNGTSQALAWNAIYRTGTDVILPTATTISKTMYIQFCFNGADTKWDIVGNVGGY
jgi:hypothetical protein